MKLVGIAGRKGHGKDASIKKLVEEHGFVVVKFADGLKNMLRTYLRMRGVNDILIEEMIEGTLKETPHEVFGGKTPRVAMQTLGTEWGRELIYDGIWLDTFEDACAKHDRVVCTDMRFPNEVARVQKMGGTTLRIVRPCKMKKRSRWQRFLLWAKLRKPGIDEHPSETQIDKLPVDIEIVNDTTLENLQFNTASAAFYPHEWA